MSSDVIEIGRVPVEISAVTTRDRAELLRRRIADAIGDRLHVALGAFRPACGLPDDAYLFIDRVEVECHVGAHWNDDLIGRAFGKALLDKLQHRIDSGAGIRFSERAEYLAAFLVALLDGTGFSRWWFEEFEGLKLLPPSIAVRTLIISEGKTGLDALIRLTEASARQVAGSLSAPDAERLLAQVEILRRDQSNIDCESLCRFAEDGDLTVPLGSAERLLRWIALERVTTISAGAVDLEKLRLIDALFAAARAGALTQVIRPVQSARHVLQACFRGIGEPAQSAVVFSDADCQILVERLTRMAAATEPDDQDTAQDGFRYTPHGGALLLLLRLLRMQWWQHWAAVLEEDNEERVQWVCPGLALLIVATALDPDDADTLLADDLLRTAFGVDPDLEFDAFRHEHEGLCVALLADTDLPVGERDVVSVGREAGLDEALATAASALLAHFAAAIPGCAGSSDAYLREQFCRCRPSSRSRGRQRVSGSGALRWTFCSRSPASSVRLLSSPITES